MNQTSMYPAKQPAMLSGEDRNRMSRLYEEVLIRLEEMAMIAARTLKLKAGRGSAVRFCPFPPGMETDFEAVELVRTAQRSGCYDYHQGTCFELERAGSETCSSKEEGRNETSC